MDNEDIVYEDSNNDNSTSNLSSGNGNSKTTYGGRDNFHNNAARRMDNVSNGLNNMSERLRNAGRGLNDFASRRLNKNPDSRLARAANGVGNGFNKIGNGVGKASDVAGKVNDGVQGVNNAANALEDPLGTATDTAKDKVVDKAKDVAGEAADKAGKVVKKGLVKVLLPLLPWIIVGLLIIFLVIIVVSFFIAIFSAFDNSSGGIAASGNGTCSYNVNGQIVTNLKVRLLNCEGNIPVPGEDLIDFEDYITGVVYQEVGDAPMEALKVQAIVARSFSLTRPKIMGNSYGLSLKEENGQWILSLRSCTNDQVFCNPNKGCWSNRVGGQTSDSNPGDWPNCTVHSGYDKSKTWSRAALATTSKIRQAVEETRGQVLEDTKGNIVYTNFNNSNQQRWASLAREGKDAFEILTKDYGSGKRISAANCTSGGGELTGANDYVGWMINFANDNTHGYSQANRTMNPDVDCSSFVYYGLLNGGGFSKSKLGNYPFATSSMRPILEKIGFRGHKFTSVSDLKRGDILWRSGHTEVYVGDGKNVGAHSNYDGKSGDSSGKEVNVGNTGTRWTYYYRLS